MYCCHGSLNHRLFFERFEILFYEARIFLTTERPRDETVDVQFDNNLEYKKQKNHLFGIETKHEKKFVFP